ncbi:MAG: hypothetical protein AAGI48_04005 [Verrucomicrobiota bacterium]
MSDKNKKAPESQERALLVRNAIAVLKIDFPSKHDNRFREIIVERIKQEIKNLEPAQLTRLHEAACEADAKHSSVSELRTALRVRISNLYNLGKARKRAANT